MYKLIILIEPPNDPSLFDETWPLFLREAERMPGLVKEATVRVDHTLFGNIQVYMIHELFFDNLADLQTSMGSPHGQTSGNLLQRITEGRMSLLVAEHREDDMANIRKYQSREMEPDPD